MFERAQAHRLGDSKRSLLVGPRQVGKTTLLSSLGPDLTINLADLATFRDYVAQPERLERELAAVDRSVRTVLIDEVQKVPELLDRVRCEPARRAQRRGSASRVTSRKPRSMQLRATRAAARRARRLRAIGVVRTRPTHSQKPGSGSRVGSHQMRALRLRIFTRKAGHGKRKVGKAETGLLAGLSTFCLPPLG